MLRSSILPPYLLARLAGLPERHRFAAAAAAARRALRDTEPLQRARTLAGPTGTVAPAPDRPPAGAVAGLVRRISDAGSREVLPGRTVRTEGKPAVGDPAVDEAYEGLGATYTLFRSVYGRDSVDGRGMPLAATVHYGQDYDNAFWDGSRMVFGDGDGEVFRRFTRSLSVIGHELGHAVVQYTADLRYQGQSGALNESLCDVFGALVEQHSRGQSAREASWLIGAELFTPAVTGVALRSMSAPGTAYDDDVLGRDPQPASFAQYISTAEDNGGVHLNSGIPNRAFYLAAVGIGGSAWAGAGAVWYDALTEGDLGPSTDFATFAAATIRAAERRFGAASPGRNAVAEAWRTVGLSREEPQK